MPYVENGAIRIFYEELGRPDGPTVFLHHGAGTSHLRWIETGIAERLADRYRLIAIDARGHGRSDAPTRAQDYRSEARLADVTSVLDAAGVEAVHFLGYSLGARAGFRLLGTAPERVLSFIGGGGTPYQSSAAAYPRLLRPIIFRRRPAGRIEGALASLYLATVRRARIARRAGWRSATIQTAIARASVYQGSYAEVLPTIAVPTLLFVGDRDRLAPVEIVRHAADSIRDAEFEVIEDTDHGLALERPIVADLISSFLDRHAPAAPN